MSRPVIVVLAVLAAAGTVAGCTSASPSTTDQAANAGSTVEASAAPATAAPTTAAAAPSAAAVADSVPSCTTSQLALHVQGVGGAAGTSYWTIQLVNDGTAACRTAGYPGASFLDSSGQQVGLAATRSGPAQNPTVTITAGGHSDFFVGVPNPGNFTESTGSASSCKPATTAQLRIYPPNQTTALTTGLKTSVCTTDNGRPIVSAVGATS